MGIFEDILVATEPLDDVAHDLFITYDAKTDTTDIFFKSLFEKPGGINHGKLMFHTDENSILTMYFVLVPSPLTTFIPDGEAMSAANDVIVFSGKDVFQYLGIDYPSPSGGFMEDLNGFAQAIHRNSSKILDAFSDINIKKTYKALKSRREMSDKINRRVKNFARPG